MKNQRQSIIFDLKEAKRLMRFWQKELRLQDWDIDLQICRRDDLCLAKTSGTNTTMLGLKYSCIQLLDPKDFESNVDVYDMEQTLVHELLHISFAIIDNQLENGNNNRSPLYIEQVIDQLATALVNVKRNS